MDQNDQQQKNGALVGSAIIVILLIIGGVYLAHKKLSEIKQNQNPEPPIIEETVS